MIVLTHVIYQQSVECKHNKSGLPTADDNGMYTSDLCHIKVRVGCGGCKNVMQHRRSQVTCVHESSRKGYLKSKLYQEKNEYIAFILHETYTGHHQTVIQQCVDSNSQHCSRLQCGQNTVPSGSTVYSPSHLPFIAPSNIWSTR
jgi:hypothetical protein